ncbi:putative Exported protein [Nitrospira tepida]|uniref:Exported protein n=1 Tax=Nitrospira tepida TaxID=2973512 RepID=A0AA86T4F6_9BACT|nr:cysteine rich repeat-containing protein [Nitrospira tepida]CAI4031467.1 putative Exported protein [Nitrospira tepida]
MPDPRPGRSSWPAKLVTCCVLGFVWSLIWVNLPKTLFSAWTGTRLETGFESRPSLIMAPESRPGPERGQPPGGTPAVSRDATGSPAFPRDQPVLSLEREPELNCAEEVRKLCGEVEPGSGRFRDCLRMYGSWLPAACQRRPGDQEGRSPDGARAVLASCRADIRKVCPQAPLRGGPILHCLRTHAEELSSTCTEVLIQQRVLD